MTIKRICRMVVLAVASFCVGLPMPAQAQTQQSAQAAIDRALSKVSPSLVRIQVVVIDHRDGREIRREGAGSGTIITPDGHVVTNHHVAGRARRIVCTLPTKEEVSAELVGTDPLSDISVLKLKPKKPTTFPAAQFGDSSTLRVGDAVLALGSPFALSQSVTLGIVSNTEMVMPAMFWPFNRLTLEGEDVGSIVRWIGHDAPIFGGNSGGPLVNLEGQIVGVNEISLGLSGAIPGNLARDVAGALMKEGRVARSWIGLEVQPLLKSFTVDRGVLVGGAIEGSPAAKAGFAPGDVLVMLEGQPVRVRFREELPLFNQMVMRLPRGRAVTAVVLRDGAEKTIEVVPDDREGAEARPRELSEWGMTASNLTSLMAKELHRPNRDGVRVRGLRPGGPAQEAKPELIEDDVIVRVDDTETDRVDDLIKLTERALKAGGRRVDVLVTFERGTEEYMTVVELGRSGLEDPGLEATKASLPVAIQVLTRPLADKLKLQGRTGVRVTRVDGESAERAGLRVGDIIVALDGSPITASQPSEVDVFPAMLRQYRIGATVELTVLRPSTGSGSSELAEGRHREEKKLTATLAAAPKLPREMRKYNDEQFDFRVRDLARADRTELSLKESERGVLVDAVGEGGWAALAYLARGDMILRVDGDPVSDSVTMGKKMAEIAAKKPASVVMLVRRGIRTFFVEMQPDWGR